ncbi:MAG: hypothetical protein ACRYG7_08795 [Janthinobacterium lividum]
MAIKTIGQLADEIDLTVPPQGGRPKVTGPGLNILLHDLTDTLSAPAPRVYEEVIHFPSQPLFIDTIFEASMLLRLTAGPGVARVELAIGTGSFQTLLDTTTATEYVPNPPLPLPVGNLTYRITFQEGVSYAALKQVIRIA